MSVEDRSKRTGAVRPQFGELRESQFECDSFLNVKSDGNDICRRDGRMRTWRTERRDSMTGKEHSRPRSTDCPRTPRAHDHASHGASSVWWDVE